MASITEITATSPSAVVSGEHVEFSCVFTTGGTAVNVISPVCTIATTGGTPVTIAPANLLVPFSKDGPGAGQYKMCFLSTGIADGDYSVVLSGRYPTATGGTLAFSSGFSIRACTNVVQGYIEMVRATLQDTLPQLYIIEDPEKFLYKDGQIYDALNRALMAINATPPYRYTFELGNCPWPSLLIEGAMIFLLASRGVLEIMNTLSYNDEISFAIDRSGKLQSMAQMFYSNWVQERLRAKRELGFARAKAIGIGSTRMPFALVRVWGFSSGLKSTFASLESYGS